MTAPGKVSDIEIFCIILETATWDSEFSHGPASVLRAKAPKEMIEENTRTKNRAGFIFSGKKNSFVIGQTYPNIFPG